MQNRDLDFVFVDFKIRRQNSVVQLRDFRDLRGAFRVDGDDLASLQAVAGAVDNLAVNQDVAMRHDLAGGENRAGEAGTIDDGHQTHFQIAEELVTRDAFAALRVLIDEAELMLGQVVERPQLLLFEKQFAVGGELAAAFGRAMLTGGIITRLAGGSATLSTVTGGSRVGRAVRHAPQAVANSTAQCVLRAFHTHFLLFVSHGLFLLCLFLSRDVNWRRLLSSPPHHGAWVSGQTDGRRRLIAWKKSFNLIHE